MTNCIKLKEELEDIQDKIHATSEMLKSGNVSNQDELKEVLDKIKGNSAELQDLYNTCLIKIGFARVPVSFG